MAWHDRTWKWPIHLAAFMGLLAIASPGRADVLVSSLEESSTSLEATKGFSPASTALNDESSRTIQDTQLNRLALLTTIMFFNGGTPSGGGSGGSGGGGGG